MTEYGVWENETGVFWTVNPPTLERASGEARLCAPGHEPVTVEMGNKLRNAFAAGRMYGHEQARKAIS